MRDFEISIAIYIHHRLRLLYGVAPRHHALTARQAGAKTCCYSVDSTDISKQTLQIQ